MSTDQHQSEFSHKGAKVMLWGSGGYLYTTSPEGRTGTVIEIEECVADLLCTEETKMYCSADLPERAVQLIRMLYPLTYQRWVNKFEALRDGTWEEEEEMYYEGNT